MAEFATLKRQNTSVVRLSSPRQARLLLPCYATMLHCTRMAAFALCALLLAPFFAFCFGKPDPAKRTRNDALFTNGMVRAFSIEIPPAEMEKLKKEPRTYVHAKVNEGTNTFEDVGLHLKGVGSFRPLEQKPSFTIKFNKFTRQEFYGLSKIALN